MTAHNKGSEFVTGALDGPVTDRASGQDELRDVQVMDNIERKS